MKRYVLMVTFALMASVFTLLFVVLLAQYATEQPSTRTGVILMPFCMGLLLTGALASLGSLIRLIRTKLGSIEERVQMLTMRTAMYGHMKPSVFWRNALILAAILIFLCLGLIAFIAR